MAAMSIVIIFHFHLGNHNTIHWMELYLICGIEFNSTETLNLQIEFLK